MDITQLTDGADLPAVLAQAGPDDIERLIDQAAHPDVPLEVFLAVLDRYNALTLPVQPATPGPRAFSVGAEPDGS